MLYIAMFLLDAFTEVYVWIGWWPVIENKLLKDANATTGSAYSRWLQDKKLALETALLYSKGTTSPTTLPRTRPLVTFSSACGRPKLPPVYLVHAGTEHQSFINLFPFWVINTKVQELNCKVAMACCWLLNVVVTQLGIFSGQEAPSTEGGG